MSTETTIKVAILRNKVVIIRNAFAIWETVAIVKYEVAIALS